MANRYNQTNPEKDVGIPKRLRGSIFHFYSSTRIPKHSLTDNLHKSAPVHVGIRIITNNRDVYSFGWQMPFEEQEFVLSNYFSTFLSTAQVNVSMLDFEEFRNHEGRMVTSCL
jgi:hypothetical protein